MNEQRIQINHWWKTYICQILHDETTSLPQALSSFLESLDIDFMDYEESEYGEYGDIAVRYMDIFYQQEEIEIRLIDSVTNDFSPTWGFMHQNPSKHFNAWVQKQFALDDAQTSVVLRYVEFFMRNVLSKTIIN